MGAGPAWARFGWEVRRLWAWMISRSLPNFNKIAAFPALPLSAEWFWGVGGANLIPGGGAYLSLLPRAGRWQG